MCRDELLVVQYKARVTTLQEQVKILEEAGKIDNTERSRTLKELATERGVCLPLEAGSCSLVPRLSVPAY